MIAKSTLNTAPLQDPPRRRRQCRRPVLVHRRRSDNCQTDTALQLEQELTADPIGKTRTEALRVMRRLSSLGGWSHDRATKAGQIPGAEAENLYALASAKLTPDDSSTAVPGR